MTQKNVLLLERQGFIILKDCIDKELISDVQSYAAELLKCQANPDHIIEAMENLESESKDHFYQFCKRMGQVVPVLRIAMLPRIFSLVKIDK